MNAPATQVEDKFAKLRKLQSCLRSDLQITRTQTRGVATYVFFDPVKFQSHRLSLLDYQVAGRLSDHRTLQQALDLCIEDGVLTVEDEEIFFNFVSQLQVLGLLTTSKADPGELYQKFQNRQEAMQKNAVFTLLFATIPLTNPDKFLDKTMEYVDWLFTKTALVFWSLLGLVALWIVVQRFNEFVSPLNGLLATSNLAFLSISFVALKVFHEFGHGYACKKFGGRVPEMGCKLIALMPLAYVDASSAWSFPKRSQRLIVMLAGMYIEAIIAIIGVFVWAFSPHSFAGSCAFQLIFMAGLATVLFNANPLMKYDGYFVLSDLIGIPNLRTKSTKYFHGFLKRVFLGIEDSQQVGIKDKFVLLTYGIAASLYGLVLTVSIAIMVASMFGVVGMFLAILQVGNMAWKSVSNLFGFLWSAPETAEVRVKSRFLALALGVGVPALVGFCPVPGRVAVPGVTKGSELISIRTPTDGFVTFIANRIDDIVDTDQPLVTLKNIGVESTYQKQKLEHDLAMRKALNASRLDPSEGKKLEVMASQSLSKMKVFKKEADKLTITSPQRGRLMFLIDERMKGAFLNAGEIVAKVSAGKCQVRAWISEENLANADIELHQRIELRFADRPGTTYHGTIETVAPAKNSTFDDLALTTMGNGGIKINPENGQTEENMYMLEIEVNDLDADETRLDSRVTIVLKRRYQSLASWIGKSMQKFVGRLTL